MGKFLFCLAVAIIGGAAAVGGLVLMFFGNLMQALLLLVCGALTLWFGISGIRELRPKQKKPITKKHVVITCVISGLALITLVTGIVFANAWFSVKTLRAELYDYSHQALDRWVMNDIPYFEGEIEKCSALERLFLTDVLDDFEQWKVDTEQFVIDYAKEVDAKIDALDPATVAVITSASHRTETETTIARLTPDTANYFGVRLKAHLRNLDKLESFSDAFDEALARCASPCTVCETGRIPCGNCGATGVDENALCRHCDGIGSRNCMACEGGTVYTYGK